MPRKTGKRLFVVVISAMLLGACASSPRAVLEPARSQPDEQACVALFQAMDRAVLAFGVRDGAAAPLPHYPWFRSSRLIQEREPWLRGAELAAALLEQDRQARAMELSNLPSAALAALLAGLPQTDAGVSVWQRGTRRDEQLLFWVSGVLAPGAMRQMGRHATAFVGRSHFDDPDILARTFPMPAEPGDSQ